jgi:predicted O-methyltransferase YrrM
MNDRDAVRSPAILDALMPHTARIGVTMASEEQTGSLLRLLAASKPGGRLLELGTGTGVGTAWLLAGMDSKSELDSVEHDSRSLDVARRHLGHDLRVRFHLADAAAFLTQAEPRQFDLIYADTWAGKFTHVDLALSLLRTGGFYVVDDLLPQPNWPTGHAAKVPVVVADLEGREEFVATRLAWATGLMILVRTAVA